MHAGPRIHCGSFIITSSFYEGYARRSPGHKTSPTSPNMYDVLHRLKQKMAAEKVQYFPPRYDLQLRANGGPMEVCFCPK